MVKKIIDDIYYKKTTFNRVYFFWLNSLLSKRVTRNLVKEMGDALNE